ncbi:MAG: hypothetical protein ABSG68_17180, partial [Thermoguttaceae bacterium]
MIRQDALHERGEYFPTTKFRNARNAMSSEGTKSGAKPRRRWFQYSLRSLMVFVTVTCIALGWFTARMRRARTQREAVATIEAEGGRVLYEYDYRVHEKNAGRTWSEYSAELGHPPTPKWLRDLLGDDFFATVASVRDLRADDARLEELARCFPDLERLFVSLAPGPCTPLSAGSGTPPGRETQIAPKGRISGAGLRHLWGLPGLKTFGIQPDEAEVGIEDQALRNIEGLTHLESFFFFGPVADPELEHVSKLRNLRVLQIAWVEAPFSLAHLPDLTDLRELYLENVRLTDAAFGKIAQLPRLRTLALTNTPMNDARIEHLTALRELRQLSLSGYGRVTRAGLERLCALAGLQELDLYGTSVREFQDDDVMCLGNLRELRVLVLPDSVTAAGIAALRRALPNCHITNAPRCDDEVPSDCRRVFYFWGVY